jgi:diguanylate cyclase
VKTSKNLFRGKVATSTSDEWHTPVRRTHATQMVIAAAYGFDSAILLGYCRLGLVDVRVSLAAIASLALLVATAQLALRWPAIRQLRDPTLFLPQQMAATTVALGVALAAPQIGYQPIATLFAIAAFSFMAPDRRTLIISWLTTGAAVVAIFCFVGPELAMPTSTAGTRALTAAVTVGLLARCVWISLVVQRLRARLRGKNDELTEALAKIAVLATVDDCTALPNRRSILDTLDREIARSRREGTPLSLAYIDLDRFKSINDMFGHKAGDRVLRLFADAAIGAIRETDQIGRVGGEEFLLTMPATTLMNARAAMERLRERLKETDWGQIESSLNVTASIGVAAYRAGEAREVLMQRADQAMFVGKTAGRDKIVLSSD